VERILELKGLYPAWGPRKLHVLLEQEKGKGVCSRSSVDRILARNNLRDCRQASLLQEAAGRFERDEANDLWQIDFTAPFSLADGVKVWPVPVLDDSCRYCVSLLAAPSCTGEYAIEAFRAAAKVYGLPKQVLSDHGSAFGVSRSYISEFCAYLWACDVEHIQGRYAHPQTQGKLERFNRTLQLECITRHSYTSLEDWSKCFEEYRHIYNNIRPHQSIYDATPASKYKASLRAFAEPNRHYRQPGEGLEHRRVGNDGKIWLFQHQVKVGRGLAGWSVSARHDGAGIWTILFRGKSICQVSVARVAQYKPRP
jgi:transposase InsO family protein